MTAFCTTHQLFELLVMSKGSSASPGWLVKVIGEVINEVIKSLERVTVYLDDIIVFDCIRIAHTANIGALFARLRKYNHIFPPEKAKRGAITADCLGQTITARGLSPNSARVAALIEIPMPQNQKQVHSLLGCINYYCKFLVNRSRRFRPIDPLLKQRAAFDSTPCMKTTVRDTLPELAKPQIRVCPRLRCRRQQLPPLLAVSRRQP